MNPNAKKLRDNPIKINVDHYDYQILLAHSERSGIDLAILVRQLAMRQIHDLVFREQPIAMILPSQNTVEMPLGHFWAMTQAPASTAGVTSHA